MGNCKDNDFSICSKGDTAELKKIRDVVYNRAIDFGFADDLASKITLAVDEACSNLVRHAYRNDATKEICVKIETENSNFIVKIFDEGSPFNPIEVSSPNMDEYFKELKRGGLGIHIIKLIMDEISYVPSNDQIHMNMLCLKKALH